MAFELYDENSNEYVVEKIDEEPQSPEVRRLMNVKSDLEQSKQD